MATCEHCGRPFEAQRSTARFCGPTCRQGARRGTAPPDWRSRPAEPRRPPPSLRAWVGSDQWRWWVTVEGDPPRTPFWPLEWDDRWSQYTVGRGALGYDALVEELRREGYAAVRVEGTGPLPPRWLLELSHGTPIAQGLGELLRAVPAQRRRKLLIAIAAAAHPDGATRRSAGADELLLLANRFKDEL